MKRNTIDVSLLTATVNDYFNESAIQLSEEFDIIICAESISQSVQNTVAILCNLENIEIIKEVANGDYSRIDIDDASQFNDSYYDMCEFLNL